MRISVDEAIATKVYLADPWFHVCLNEAIQTPEFLENFDRLTGHNVARKGTPVELAIDNATGREKAGLAAFAEFVARYVWAVVGPEGKRES